MSDIEQIVYDLTKARWEAMVEYLSDADAEITRLREENARLRDIVCKYLEGSMREKDIRAAAAAIRDSRNYVPEGANDE